MTDLDAEYAARTARYRRLMHIAMLPEPTLRVLDTAARGWLAWTNWQKARRRARWLATLTTKQGGTRRIAE